MVKIFFSKKVTVMTLALIAICLNFVKLPQLFYVNVSPSLPIGFYKIKETSSLEKGAIIAFFPPEKVHFLQVRNWLSLDIPILKPVVALDGDHCCIQNKELKINGKKYCEIAKIDTEGLDLPQIDFCRDLTKNEIWVGSNRIKNSFDSRYFGVIQKTKILAMVTPWLVLR